MKNVVDFSEKKLDMDLKNLLEKYERVAPSKTDIEREMNKFKQNHNLCLDVTNSGFLPLFSKVFFQTFHEFVQAYRNYTLDNIFSVKLFIHKTKQYDLALTVLDDYIDKIYTVDCQDTNSNMDRIDKIDQILDAVDLDYESLSIAELKCRIEEYIRCSEKIYNCIFNMLKKNDVRCVSLLGEYSIVIPHISYYPFKQYVILINESHEC